MEARPLEQAKWTGDFEKSHCPGSLYGGIVGEQPLGPGSGSLAYFGGPIRNISQY